MFSLTYRVDAGHHVVAAVFAKCLTLPLSGANHVSLVTTSRASLWRPIAGASKQAPVTGPQWTCDRHAPNSASVSHLAGNGHPHG